MKRKLFFILLATLLLTPWPVAYAYSDTLAGQDPVQVVAAEPAATPHWTAFGKTIGGVTPGDLFYIDTNNSTVDMHVALYITNIDELIHYYRYLTLNIGVYTQTGTDQWEKATMGNGELLPDTYITMLNGQVSFMLPGYARYKITIDDGCYYCYGAGADKSTASPKFYLTTG